MKAYKVQLKETAFKYKDVLMMVLSRPINPMSGITMPEIRQCNKILDKLDEAKDVVLLSEEEFTFLKNRVEIYPYALGGKDVGKFGDDIANSEVIIVEPKIEPKKVKP